MKILLAVSASSRVCPSRKGSNIPDVTAKLKITATFKTIRLIPSRWIIQDMVITYPGRINCLNFPLRAKDKLLRECCHSRYRQQNNSSLSFFHFLRPVYACQEPIDRLLACAYGSLANCIQLYCSLPHAIPLPVLTSFFRFVSGRQI